MRIDNSGTWMISESRERFERKVRKLSEKLKILRFPGDVVSIRGGRKIPDLPLFEVLARVPEKSEKCRKSEISGPRTRFCRSRNPGNPDIFGVAILPQDLAPIFPGPRKISGKVRKVPFSEVGIPHFGLLFVLFSLLPPKRKLKGRIWRHYSKKESENAGVAAGLHSGKVSF